MPICRKLDPVYCEQKKKETDIILIEDLFIAVLLVFGHKGGVCMFEHILDPVFLSHSGQSGH